MADTPSSDVAPVESPFQRLELQLIDEFLRATGHDPAALGHLPPDEREALMTEASIYASSRLSEVESRSHFVHDLHDIRPGHTQTGFD